MSNEVDAETKRTWGNLCSMAVSHSTLTKKQLKSLLLATGGQVICCGHLRDICSKHLGVEVYKVWTEKSL